MRMRKLAQIIRVRIHDMVNSRVGVHGSLQLDQRVVREFSDMAKSHMHTREFAQIKRMQIRIMAWSNSRVCAS